ncbi:MAG TPA: DUF2267 domain-containing protein [Acidimicrobiales bacterium]|nr:DUF2267 domain-containing protein [Acidimicrobiales bacterium]
MRRRSRWMLVGAAVTGVAAAFVGRPGTAVSKRLRRTLSHVGGALRYAEGRMEGASYRLRGREPDPSVADDVLADRIRSRLGRLEHELDLPRVHVMVERHVVLLHGEVGTRQDLEEIEKAVEAVPGVAGVESYLHVGLGPWDTRPSSGHGVHPPSAALRALVGAAERAGVAPAAAPLVVRGVLATFADRLPSSQRAHLTSHLPHDVRPLLTPPRRIRDAPPVRSLHDLVGRIAATTSGLELAQAEQVTADVVHTLADLVPDDVGSVAAVLPAELRVLWESGPSR